jgi:hypothetical protein
MLGERPEQTAARKARLAEKYPVEFGTSDATTVLGIDGYKAARGEAPSGFSLQAMRLAQAAGQERPK